MSVTQPLSITSASVGFQMNLPFIYRQSKDPIEVSAQRVQIIN